MNDRKLQILTETISKNDFHKPFLHKAVFNPRLRTTGGRYLLKSHNIEVNKKYYDQLGEEELIGIIKHELCHYHLHLEGKGYRHQDPDFKRLMNQVGAPRFCSPLPQSEIRNRTSRIVVYQCSKCDQVFKRKRRINTSKYVCGKCTGKLIEVEVLT